ncbi:MAG: DUF3455 domain-containing protein [Actinomycetota bacterium]|nr:DUF3455 domain-containing protein [Actinomycetota bacterium]
MLHPPWRWPCWWGWRHRATPGWRHRWCPPTWPFGRATCYLVGHARGYQFYTCQVQANGYGWVLQTPWAGLVDDSGRYVARHYAGPTWAARDNSAVVAAPVASAPAPSGDAIPWLLLQGTSTSGPSGGTFSGTTYIQRINTTGGLAPTSGCDAAHVGATAAVYYTADYYFYRAA